MICLAFGMRFLRDDQHVLGVYRRRQAIDRGLQQRCLAIQRQELLGQILARQAATSGCRCRPPE